MTTNKDLLQNTFQIYYPEMKELLPFTIDGHLPNGDYPYMCFEFVGDKTHFEVLRYFNLLSKLMKSFQNAL